MDHGGGGVTALPMIAAELLGLTAAQYQTNVTAVMSDSSLTTDTGVTAGSRMTRNGGIGLVAAATNLGTQWFPLIAAKLAAGTKATNLAFGGGSSGQPSGIIFDTTKPSNQMTFAQACALLPAAGLTGVGSFTPPAKTAYRVGGTKICEVEVDTETADVRVIDYVGALGLGRVIFAMGANGQNQGGFLGLGVGETFYEQNINDSSTGLTYSGGTLNPNYLDNKIPSIYQTPNRALSLWSEYVDTYGPFGGVGIGENTLMSVIPTILNALSNAMGGYRFVKVPVRKEDIVTALQWMKANGKL
jgi:CO/xanthine dehydrogenase Mo-binding subunit